jgi:hypothetical protein
MPTKISEEMKELRFILMETLCDDWRQGDRFKAVLGAGDVVSFLILVMLVSVSTAGLFNGVECVK